LRRAVEMNEKASFLSELRRRNVIRMAGLYLVGAWLVVQVAGTVLPMFGAPEWLPRTIVVFLAIGVVPAVFFSWFFELTPEGLKREEDVTPDESIAPKTGRRMDCFPSGTRCAAIRASKKLSSFSRQSNHNDVEPHTLTIYNLR